jgi:hypothetical protein
MALSTIASKQAKGTKSTMKKCKQLLDYLATHPNATVQFHASDMILSIHSDASISPKPTLTVIHVAIFSWAGNRTH